MRTMSGGPCLHYECTNRNSFGYCKTTACINPKYSNIGTAQYGQGAQKRIVTNADRIRSMTDEELAEFIEYLTNGCDYLYPKCYASEFCTSGVCRNAWLDWLKEKVET